MEHVRRLIGKSTGGFTSINRPFASATQTPSNQDSKSTADSSNDESRDTSEPMDTTTTTITPPRESFAIDDEPSEIAQQLEEGDSEMLDVSMIDVPMSESFIMSTTKSGRPRKILPPPIERPKRSSRGPAVYNLCKLSGTDVHGKRAAKGDKVSGRIRRKSAASRLVDDIDDEGEGHDDEENTQDSSSLHPATKNKIPRNTSSTRLSSNGPTSRKSAIHESSSRSSSIAPATSSTSVNAKRRRSEPAFMAANKRALISEPLPVNPAANLEVPEPSGRAMKRELRRLRDTDEFAHIDNKPVLHTVWSNGKLMVVPSRSSTRGSRGAAASSTANSDSARSTPTIVSTKVGKKADSTSSDKDKDKETSIDSDLPEVPKKRPVKKYMEHGFYAGQTFKASEILKSLSADEKKLLAQSPELQPKSSAKDNKSLPAPIFAGLRMLLQPRDFKLPYDVFNPLPPGQSKPGDWRKMTKNRFIGDSRDYWRNTHDEEWQSKCVCNPEDGCGESCQNRIMLYECDEENCNIGPEYCTNRAFESLAKRKAQGNKYSMGVEVIKTESRGYGVRANRCFQANQIIVEYTGEIITEEECQRRMQEVYKHNECFYLMSFDQNMILDATTGSIARFVNHSCKPNCRMVKWVVHGQPRMALFAGDEPIMTGDELTYDYKFDPFSSKNMQKCLCGSENCRGWLTSKEAPQVKEVKEAMRLQKAQVKAAAAEAARKEKVAAQRAKNKSVSKTQALVLATAAKKAAAVKTKVQEMRRANNRAAAKPLVPGKNPVGRPTAAMAAAKRKRALEEAEAEERVRRPYNKRTKLPMEATRRSSRRVDPSNTGEEKTELLELPPVTRKRPVRRASSRLTSAETQTPEVDVDDAPTLLVEDDDDTEVQARSDAVAISVPVALSSSSKVEQPVSVYEIPDSDSISSLSDVEIEDLDDIAEAIEGRHAQTSGRSVTGNQSYDTSKSDEREDDDMDHTDSLVILDDDDEPHNTDEGKNSEVGNDAGSEPRRRGRPTGKAAKKPEAKEKSKDMGLTAAATLRKRAPQKSRVKRLPNGELAVNKKWKVVARNPKALAAEAKASEEAAKRAAEAATSRVPKKRPTHVIGGPGPASAYRSGPTKDARVRWEGPNRSWFRVQPTCGSDAFSRMDNRPTSYNRDIWQAKINPGPSQFVSENPREPRADRATRAERPAPVTQRAPVTASQPQMFNERPPPLSDRPAPLVNRPPPLGTRPPPLGDRPPPLADRPVPLTDRPAPLSERPPPLGHQYSPATGRVLTPTQNRTGGRSGGSTPQSMSTSVMSALYRPPPFGP